MTTYTSLEEITVAYASAFETENLALFEQGYIVAAAVDQGYATTDVVKACAAMTRRQARTVFDRYAVARTFRRDEINPQLDWYTHLICAQTDTPHEWLARAADENMSSRQLKAAIKAGGGDPETAPVYLLDAVTAQLWSVGDNCFIVRLDDFAQAASLKAHERAGVVVTLVLQAVAVAELEQVA